MSALPKLYAQAYLEQERLSDTKHEFYNGDIFAMSGASFAHNLITGNLVRSAPRRGCAGRHRRCPFILLCSLRATRYNSNSEGTPK